MSAAYQSGSSRFKPDWPKVTTLCGMGRRASKAGRHRRLRLRHRARCGMRRQIAEGAVEQRLQRRGRDVADNADHQRVLGEARPHEGTHVGGGDARDRFGLPCAMRP